MSAISRIMVVDDQPQNIQLLEAYLSPEGYDVITAVSGPTALARMATENVDLVLLDVMMPVMNGFEVLAKIRQDAVFGKTPVILVTALRDTEYRVRGIEAGCDDFISKPVDRLELMARVRSLIKVKAYNDLMLHYREDLESEVALRTEDLRKAYETIKAASLDTIYRLSMAAEYKDKETGAHIKRMSAYSAAIAKQIGLDAKATETILYAAPMHDLGKIGIPDSILMKPGKLDAEEWVSMKQHTVIGAKILHGSDAEFIKLGEIIALSHHEKWDGSGYPQGLKGDMIPLAGRITAVADVFDALTSRRPYKEPFSAEAAVGIILQGRATHFDPQIVDAFIAIKEEILSIMEKYSDALQ